MKAELHKTYIDKMHINKFRSFKNTDISIGRNLTMISGLNGTGKSTILGILAQICGFRKNYYRKDSRETIPSNYSPEDVSSFKTIYNVPFESNFTNHFKISPKFDIPNADNYDVNFEVFDSEEKLFSKVSLKGTQRSGKLRLVLRRNKTIASNSSRNITFPTIYLSLRRLTPYVNRKEHIKNALLSKDEEKKFIEISNNIFIPVYETNCISSNEEGTSGVNSTVVTGSNYDIKSASTGEDNLGQIIGAMISFIRLKKKWSHYRGGLLLIDELDASIFPYAQKTLLRELDKFSSKFDVQIVFTTHSPIIMGQMIQLKNKALPYPKTKSKYSTNFISNEFGSPINHTNYSLEKMLSNLNLKEYALTKSTKINCYCEDEEGYDFLTAILDSKLKEKVRLMRGINLGGDQLKELRKHKVPEFTFFSIVILDGDKNSSQLKNFLSLPSPIPPDQLMYKLLDDSEANDVYWHSNTKWNKLDFKNKQSTKNIKNNLKFDSVKNSYTIFSENHDKKVRDYFKEWAHENKKELHLMQTNPIKQIWIKNNLDKISKFKTDFTSVLNCVVKK